MNSVKDVLNQARLEALVDNSGRCAELISQARTLLLKGYGFNEDLSALKQQYRSAYDFPIKPETPTATPPATVMQKPCIVHKHYSNSGSGLVTSVFIVFLVMKLSGAIDWGWWWVISPAWGLFALHLLDKIIKNSPVNKQS